MSLLGRVYPVGGAVLGSGIRLEMEETNLDVVDEGEEIPVLESPKSDAYRDAVDTDGAGGGTTGTQSAMSYIAGALMVDTAPWGARSRDASVASSAGRGTGATEVPRISSAADETDDASVGHRYGTYKSGPKTRKRGRPVTTGGHYRLLERKVKRQAEIDLRREIDIDDPEVLPAQPQRPKGPFEEDFIREFYTDTPLELGTRAAEHALRVEKSCASNLKGTDVRRLRESVRTLGASVKILVGRAEASNEDQAAAREREDLRRDIRSLRGENDRLRAEVKAAHDREMAARERADKMAIEAIKAAPSVRSAEIATTAGGSTGGLADDEEDPPLLPPPPEFIVATPDRVLMPPPLNPPPKPAARPPSGRRRRARAKSGSMGGEGGSLAHQNAPPQLGSAGEEGSDTVRLSREVDRLLREISALNWGGGAGKGGGTKVVETKTSNPAAPALPPTPKGGKKKKKKKEEERAP